MLNLAGKISLPHPPIENDPPLPFLLASSPSGAETESCLIT